MALLHYLKELTGFSLLPHYIVRLGSHTGHQEAAESTQLGGLAKNVNDE